MYNSSWLVYTNRQSLLFVIMIFIISYSVKPAGRKVLVVAPEPQSICSYLCLFKHLCFQGYYKNVLCFNFAATFGILTVYTFTLWMYYCTYTNILTHIHVELHIKPTIQILARWHCWKKENLHVVCFNKVAQNIKGFHFHVSTKCLMDGGL